MTGKVRRDVMESVPVYEVTQVKNVRLQFSS